MDSSNTSKGCHHCLRRRIICDRTVPHCTKCKAKRLTCPGYGVRYRFVPINTVIARGDPRMAASDGIHTDGESAGRAASDESRERSQVTTRNRSVTLPRRRKFLGDEKQPDRHTAEHREAQNHRQWSVIPSSRTHLYHNADASTSHVGAFNMAHFRSSNTSSGSVQRILDPMGAKNRFLLDHFLARISLSLDLFDGAGNGWRNHVLPLAHADPMVQQAICANASFYLAPRMPHYLGAAEKGKAAIISHLRKKASREDALDESTWMVIILLIVGDLVNGNDEIISLYRMLISFMAARGTTELKSPLAKFLYFQTQLIAFHVHHIVALCKGIEGASLALPSPMEQFVQLDPGWHSVRERSMFSTHLEMYRVAAEIHLLRAESHSAPIDKIRMNKLLEQLRGLFEKLGEKPGFHVMAWPGFIGAMEALSEEQRNYFVEKVRRVCKLTGFRSMSQSLDMLPTVCDRQTDHRWTESMASLRSFAT